MRSTIGLLLILTMTLAVETPVVVASVDAHKAPEKEREVIYTYLLPNEAVADSLGYHVIPDQYKLTIFQINLETKIPVNILANVIEIESGWVEDCMGGPNQNGTYDMGLMQLNSAYLADFSWKFYGGKPINPLMAEPSLVVGMRLMKHLYNLTGNWSDAIAAYNCGLSRVRRGDIPESTKVYIQKVMEGS